MKDVNTHAKEERYAVTKRRSRKAKDGKVTVYFCCDKGRRYGDRSVEVIRITCCQSDKGLLPMGHINTFRQPKDRSVAW